jgi:hypothetical protein
MKGIEPLVFPANRGGLSFSLLHLLGCAVRNAKGSNFGASFANGTAAATGESIAASTPEQLLHKERFNWRV